MPPTAKSHSTGCLKEWVTWLQC